MKLEKYKIEIDKLLEMIYWLYFKDLKNGEIKNEIYSVNKQTVGKSARKAKTFQQTKFIFK